MSIDVVIGDGWVLLEVIDGGVGRPVLATPPTGTVILDPAVRWMYVPGLIGINCLPIPMVIVPKYGIDT